MITKNQYIALEKLYDYYNSELFDGKLNDCMIITSRKKNCFGHFGAGRWRAKKNKENIIAHEINLNPDFLDRADEEWQSTLVHEMVHLWQSDFGKPSRDSYHNKQWAQKMEEIGLMPSSTGEEGGKKTGQNMSHYIIPDGAFIQAFNRLTKENIEYISDSTLSGNKTTVTNNRKKTKYVCLCGFNVWGKPDLHIMCKKCDTDFTVEE